MKQKTNLSFFLFFCSLSLCLSVNIPSWAADSNASETVTINDQHYPVPAPWQGHKMEGHSWLAVPPLVQVPVNLVDHGGKIFLLPAACNAFVAMSAQAKQDEVTLIIDSGYRSVHYQRKVYIKQMKEGKTFAEVARYVAPPGYSEHMLGLAMDFSPSDWRFAKTPAYQWLKKHAAAFGFRETYPESRPDHQPWEPSHWRYLSPTLPPAKK
jgi:LAS superfamily LD-carboxypeptidase LdcB